MNPLELGGERSHTKQDQVNREVVAVWQGSSQSETAGYSRCCEQVHCCGEAVTICPATKEINAVVAES